MKSETVIFLNPNQIILIRNLQKELCAVTYEKIPERKSIICLPILPICVKNEELKEKAKITKAQPFGIYIEENKILLKIEMRIDGKESSGRIEVCELIFKNKDSGEDFRLKSEDFSEIWEKFAPKIKKISPFRLVQMETEENENGIVWRVLKEKWEKI